MLASVSVAFPLSDVLKLGAAMEEVARARPELSKEAVMTAVAEARSLGRLVSRAKLLELGLEEKEVMIVLRIEAAKLRASRKEQQQQQKAQMEEQIREEMGTWAEEVEIDCRDW